MKNYFMPSIKVMKVSLEAALMDSYTTDSGDEQCTTTVCDVDAEATPFL